MQIELPPPANYTEVELCPGQHIVQLHDGCITCNAKLLEWCKEVLHDIWSYDIYRLMFKARSEDGYYLRFFFQNRREATLFKLTWF